MNIKLIKERVAEGYISEVKNPNADLWIYNYTPRAQYGRVWDEATLNCRGLILDKTGAIHSRPFGKFFNYEELIPEQIPNEPFEVYEKLDGSLGVLYWIAGKPFIATRGAFGSDQARVGTQILWEKYRNTFDLLKTDRTYLFEIIYPENRIVLDYGNKKDLVLLAIIDTQSGKDLPLEDVGFPMVQRFDGINDIASLREKEEDNKEGFVIKFSSGFRLKLKFAEYVRLHRIITQVSSKIIWEHLSEKRPLDELLEKVPDEFYQWVKQTQESLQKQYADIEAEATASFKVLADRKETALYYQTQKHRAVLFKMLDKQDYSDVIWKAIKPKFEKPFKNVV